MRREDRYRRYDQFASNLGRARGSPSSESNGGESTTGRVHRTRATESDTIPPTQSTGSSYTPIFQPGSVQRSVTVDPDGTQHANETIQHGNGDYIQYEREKYYEALTEMIRAQEAEKKRLAEEREAEKRRIAEEREQIRLAREAAKQRRAQEREQIRLAREAEKQRLKEEAERQRRAEEAERQRRADEAVREAAARRNHERNMFVLGNLGNIAETLTNAQIKRNNEILRQAREQVQFQDSRQKEYIGKINIDRVQRGERFDKNVAVTFNQFGLEVPDVEAMQQPAISPLTRIDEQKRKTYVGSRLLTGVRRINQDNIDGYVEFMNGQRLHLPGSNDGYIRNIVHVMPYVYVIHINKFTPEFLEGQGYKTRRDPFDCCKNPFGCIIQ